MFLTYSFSSSVYPCSFVQTRLDNCGSEADRVIEQVTALFRIAWNLGIQLGNCEDQEPEAWDAVVPHVPGS